jgi:hypothetical protein
MRSHGVEILSLLYRNIKSTSTAQFAIRNWAVSFAWGMIMETCAREKRSNSPKIGIARWIIHGQPPRCQSRLNWTSLDTVRCKSSILFTQICRGDYVVSLGKETTNKWASKYQSQTVPNLFGPKFRLDLQPSETLSAPFKSFLGENWMLSLSTQQTSNIATSCQ